MKQAAAFRTLAHLKLSETGLGLQIRGTVGRNILARWATWTKDQSRDGAMVPGPSVLTGQVGQVTGKLGVGCTGSGVDGLCVSSAPVLPLGGGAAWRVAASRWFCVSQSPGFCLTMSAAVLEEVWGHPSPAITPGSSSLVFRPHEEAVPRFHSPGCVLWVHTRCPGGRATSQR